METASFAALVMLCAAMMLHGLSRRGRVYEFPFMAGAISASFILPQVPGIMANAFIADTAVAKTLLFTISCLLMCWLGWTIGTRTTAYRVMMFDERRLLWVAASTSLFGSYFFMKFGQLPDAERLAGILSGRAVAYLFFAKLLTYGLATALLCYWRRPSRLALLTILWCSLFYFERIVIAGRRGEAAEFVLLVLLSVWFQRGWVVPRSAVVIGLVLSFFAMLITEEYRSAVYYTDNPSWQSVLEIDLRQNLKSMAEKGGPEMTNAVESINYMDEQGRFTYGVNIWNTLVFAYVPRQIVGADLKYSLMLDVPGQLPPGYVQSVGSTSTGMQDAFLAFWYLGGLIFFANAALLGFMYRRARQGSTTMQLAYMLSVVPGILSITHFTAETAIAWVHIAAFLTPALLYAAVGLADRPGPIGSPT